MSKRLFILLLLALYPRAVSAEINLALHKSYTISPKLNYYLCTDEGDKLQLTDGKSYGSQWTRKSTVGWWKPEPVVEIVIDLGERAAIDEVRVHTVGGGFASVRFPEFVAALLSTDGREFRFGGLMSNEKLANVRSIGFRGVPRTMSVGNINAVGRYVKVVMKARPYFMFLDEVEVFGESLSATRRAKFRNNLEVFRTSEELLKRVEDYIQLRENVIATVKNVKENRSRLSGEFGTKILAELEDLAEKVGMPTNDIHSAGELLAMRDKLGDIRARIYGAVYGKAFVCLPANPMEMVFEKEMCFREGLREVNVRLWQNEYESAAFNIVSCSDEAITMAVSISPLIGPDGETIDSNKTFTIRRSIYVKGSTVGSIADALGLQGERPFILQPGELTQIWLTIFNPTLTAGTYEGRIGISGKSATGKALPVETVAVAVKVQKNKFPEKIALNTYNWAYYRVGSVSETAEDLRSHYINVCTVCDADIPWLRFTSDPPGVFRRPNFARFDKALKDHNYARTYMFFFNFRSDKKDWGRFGQWMSPRWKAAFSSWLKGFVKHLKDIGIGYDKFLLHGFDETLCDEYFELAKLVKSIDPKIRLYANSFGKGPQQFMRFRNLIDVWCPQDSQCARRRQWLEMIKSFGKEVWTYECLGPAKANDPYSYYRLMPWRAFKRGQTGAGFWVYHDSLNYKNFAVAWNDTLRPYGYYGVIYGAQTSPVGELSENIVPSRRWEAWREGVEDYQYLYELQKAIDLTRQSSPEKAKQSQRILDTQVDYVLKRPYDCDAVYRARREITKILLEVNREQPSEK